MFQDRGYVGLGQISLLGFQTRLALAISQTTRRINQDLNGSIGHPMSRMHP
jgi:hypothetical protein